MGRPRKNAPVKPLKIAKTCPTWNKNPRCSGAALSTGYCRSCNMQRVRATMDSQKKADWDAKRIAGIKKPIVIPTAPKVPGKSKYNNVRNQYDGYDFDSIAEKQHYYGLKARQMAKEISHLTANKSDLRFPLVVNGMKVCEYEADFSYIDRKTGLTVIEDVKSEATKTPLYQLKKKLMLAVHGIRIQEVMS